MLKTEMGNRKLKEFEIPLRDEALLQQLQKLQAEPTPTRFQHFSISGFPLFTPLSLIWPQPPNRLTA